MAKIYDKLTGYEAIYRDGNLVPPSEVINGERVLMIGTAIDGPKNEVQVALGTNQVAAFGRATTAPCNVVRGLAQAVVANNIGIVRVGGQFAECPVLNSQTAAMGYSSTFLYDSTLDGKYTLPYTYISGAVTVAISGNSGSGFGIIPLVEATYNADGLWTNSGTQVSGGYFDMNRKDGTFRISQFADFGTDESATAVYYAWDHDFKIRAVYPGDVYNGYYDGTRNGASIKIGMYTNLAPSDTNSGSFIIYPTANKGGLPIKVTYGYSATIRNLVNAINSHPANKCVVAIPTDMSDLNDTLSLMETSGLSISSDVNVTQNLWEGILSSGTFTAGNLTKLHFGDSEDEVFANIPVENSLYRSGTLALEWHSADTLKWDIFKELCPKDNYFGITKSTYGTFDYIAGDNSDYVVLFNMYVDDTFSSTIDTNAVKTSYRNFAVLLGEFVFNEYINGRPKMGIISYRPISDASTLDLVNTYVVDVVNDAIALEMSTQNPRTGKLEDMGKFLSIIAGPTLSMPGVSTSIYSTAEALYAAEITGLPVGQFTTNQPVPTSLLSYRYTDEQRDYLTTYNLVCFKQDYSGRVVTEKGLTFAAMYAGNASDWLPGLNIRTANSILRRVRNVVNAKRYIGQQLNSATQASISSDVRRVLDMAVSGKEIMTYSFNFKSSLRQQLLHEAVLELTLVIGPELHRITFDVSLAPPVA